MTYLHEILNYTRPRVDLIWVKLAEKTEGDIMYIKLIRKNFTDV
jgi:hypothetical protein